MQVIFFHLFNSYSFKLFCLCSKNQSKFARRLSYRNETAILKLTDETYNIKHYHIDVAYIEESVLIVADALEDLSSIDLDLNSTYAINTIKGASSFTFSNDEIILYYWAIT